MLGRCPDAGILLKRDENTESTTDMVFNLRFSRISVVKTNRVLVPNDKEYLTKKELISLMVRCTLFL